MAIMFNVEAALRHKYAAPECAILFEVRNQTGYSREVRSADAIAMSLYPSRGLSITGFEIKRSRGDWMTELKKPDKSSAIQRYCYYWYVAVSDETIVQKGELPPTWGLLVPWGKTKLKCRIEAPKLTPEPISRHFLASLMRNITVHHADQKAIDGAVAIERERLRAQFDQEREQNNARHREEVRGLNEYILAFEKASGVNMRARWEGGNIGAAVGLVRSGGLKEQERKLRSLGAQASHIAYTIQQALGPEPEKTNAAPG